MDAKLYLKEYGANAKKAVSVLGNSSAKTRNSVLRSLGVLLERFKTEIFKANEKDLEYAKNNGLSAAMTDRLLLNDKRVADMITGLQQLIELPEYANKVESVYSHPLGFKIEKRLVPLGVIGIIYESRPNVTVDAAGLCIKSGNVCILRGGSEAINTNKFLTELIQRALKEKGLDTDCVQLIGDTDREIANELMRSNDFLDLLIPRGGAGLINAVTKNATVPVIETGAGNCHIFVGNTAKHEMALNIIDNAKTQKPSVCNALEKVLIEQAAAKDFLPKLVKRMNEKGVEVRGCETCCKFVKVKPATEDDWAKEYNDLILAVKVVKDLDEALAHIEKYSTRHSEAIVTEDKNQAERFLAEVDSSAVYHNVSTRFSDGYEFGMGAEIGISTQKLHARGPMGLRELYTVKYRVTGNGQVR